MLNMGEVEKTPVRIRIALLQEKGWTIAALADALEQKINTVEKWKAGDRQPANEKSVLEMLDRIYQRRRIPKKRRYTKGSRVRKQAEDASEKAQ
jgi:ribosome-binding protein aMBF1 (putative translation factor)